MGGVGGGSYVCTDWYVRACIRAGEEEEGMCGGCGEDGIRAKSLSSR